VLAEQAAHLVALYRRLWESYVAKHADSSRVERENDQLQLAHSRLTDEESHLERRCREQEARSRHFQEVFRKVQEGVVELVEKWEDFKAELATADSAKGNKETENKETGSWGCRSILGAQHKWPGSSGSLKDLMVIAL
jgi:chromosome segregation ATPase